MSDDTTPMLRNDVMRLVAFTQSQIEQSARDIARAEITEAAKRTQWLEDSRANKRNRNRAYTLLCALGMALATPTILALTGIPSAYSIVVTILPDTVLTFWALHKHY